jgi:hypothetical protein
MLARGNVKLGKQIWCFSIPAGPTCPGKSELCGSLCYAQKGFFVMPSVKRSQQRNWEASQLGDFVEHMTEEIRKRKCRVIRIHVAGDYYSAEYVRKWHQIVKACPDVIFFTYTRSWRVPEIDKELRNYVKLRNLRMWYSVDQETGYPKRVSKRVRLAYMSVALHDVPAHKSDLVFRDYGGRAVVQKRMNGVLVCPPENGATDVTCEKCGVCWRRVEAPPKGAPDARRVPLALVA